MVGWTLMKTPFGAMHLLGRVREGATKDEWTCFQRMLSLEGTHGISRAMDPGWKLFFLFPVAACEFLSVPKQLGVLEQRLGPVDDHLVVSQQLNTHPPLK